MKPERQTTSKQKEQENAAIYARRWELDLLGRVTYASQVGSLFWCRSPRYGECVLKIGKAPEETWTEYYALSADREGIFCRVYEADCPNGALLLERISPGTPLRQEPDPCRRMDRYCTLISSLHRPCRHPERFPTYTQWIRRAARSIERIKEYGELSHHMRMARARYLGLRRRYQRNLLLHGDLHHDNILLGESGYRLIDPKGVIGDPIFEIGRFLINEPYSPSADPTGEDLRLVQGISRRLAIPAVHVLEVFYVELCMTTCWFVEDGQTQQYEERLKHIDFLRSLLDCQSNWS